MRNQLHGLKSHGFTVLELMASIALLGTLAALAIPAFTGYTERARVNAAVGEIGRVTVELHRWRMINGNGAFPDTLAAAGITMAKDPWGNDYVYEDVATAGTLRTHSGAAVNTEFDLYSKGADGATATSLTDASSLDDIVFARDGAFLGKAEYY
jgi:prepilin-type N-terminal cleavage/methylation domain-containing protein